jgi:hypothetical protein
MLAWSGVVFIAWTDRFSNLFAARIFCQGNKITSLLECLLENRLSQVVSLSRRTASRDERRRLSTFQHITPPVDGRRGNSALREGKSTLIPPPCSGTSVLASSGMQVALALISSWHFVPLLNGWAPDKIFWWHLNIWFSSPIWIKSYFRFQLADFCRGDKFTALKRVAKAHRFSLDEHLIKYFELIKYLMQLTWCGV